MVINRRIQAIARSLSFFVLPLLIGCGLAGCSSSGTLEMNLQAVRKHIDFGNSEWIEAFRNSDSDRLAQLFDAEGVMLSDAGKFHQGHEDIARAIGKSMKSFGATETTIDTDGVWLVDDIAYESGRYSYTFTPEDSQDSKTLKGRYIVNWKRQKDDTWKIAMDMGLPD